MNKSQLLLFIIFLAAQIQIPAQEEQEPIEIFLIDAYVKPEVPDRFIVSFFTSEPAKSKVIINDDFEYIISDFPSDRGTASIDISRMKFNNKTVPFIIIVEDSSGNEYESEIFDFDLPYEPQVQDESNFLLLCLFGGTIFILPSPVYVFNGSVNNFSLTKEIPLISIRSKSYKYPSGYFSVEYSYIFNAEHNSFFRLGYKHIFEVAGIEYVSPGLSGFANFNSFNGISPELSIGLFKMFDTFTVYSRYRYNIVPGASEKNYNELSIGLYSGLFSFYF